MKGLRAVDVTGADATQGFGETFLATEPEPAPALDALLAAFQKAQVSSASYGEAISLPTGFDDWRRDLLTDPQTSGGLLIAVAGDQADAVLDLVRAEGFADAALVGRMVEGPAAVRVL